MRYSFKTSVLTALGTFLLTSILVMSTFILGPKFEDRFNPVYDDLSAALVTKTDDHMDILISGKKIRRCSLFGAAAIVQIQGNGARGTSQFLKKDGTELKIEEQRIAAGSSFVRLVRIKPAGESVQLLTDNMCHPFWQTRTEIFNLPTISSVALSTQSRT